MGERMADLERLQDDLHHVRASVHRSVPGAPAGVYFLWGALVLCGFVLADIRPALVPLFWMIAAPAGAVFSGYLGWRLQKSVGHLDAGLGARYALHWGALLAVIFLGAFMIRRELISGEAFGAVVLLLLAQGYFLAGVHLDRPLRWIGLLMALGYVVVLTVATYEWTIVGVMLAAALVFAGVRESHGRAIAA